LYIIQTYEVSLQSKHEIKAECTLDLEWAKAPSILDQTVLY